MNAASTTTFRSLLVGAVRRLPACRRAYASDSSSLRWQERQIRDSYTKQAKLMGLMSRAAFKLLEMNEKYTIFRKGQTVVDLGFSPGSWSQVAIDRVSPNGRVVGLDIIPSLPPKGVSTLQGDFLDPVVQAKLREYLADPDRGRPKTLGSDKAYFDLERQETEGEDHTRAGKSVNVVLSDMMANTSGVRIKDHANSMNLCNAALLFCLDVLKPGGHFVCKFYQGSEDSELEAKLNKLFRKVYRDKPDSSRKESKEQYFVAMGLKAGVSREMIADKPSPEEPKEPKEPEEWEDVYDFYKEDSCQEGDLNEAKKDLSEAKKDLSKAKKDLSKAKGGLNKR